MYPLRSGDLIRTKGRPAPVERNDSGFTLVELLVVMAILVLLASLVAPRVIGYLGSARSKTAKIQIESLITSLELYKLDTGRFPSGSHGLKALISAPDGRRNWNGPYLKGRRVPNDPWGKPYQYIIPGRYGVYDIFSLGADNQPGGADENADVTSW